MLLREAFDDRVQYLSGSFWSLKIFEVSTIESRSIEGLFDFNCQRGEFLFLYWNSFFTIDEEYLRTRDI